MTTVLAKNIHADSVNNKVKNIVSYVSIIASFVFWLIWFINQRAYAVMLCLSVLVSLLLSLSVALLLLSSVYSPASHMVKHRNFIFGVNMYTCSQYMHVKCLVILTCSFQMTTILVIFFNMLSCPHRLS